jgi:hypothetical protein
VAGAGRRREEEEGGGGTKEAGWIRWRGSIWGVHLGSDGAKIRVRRPSKLHGRAIDTPFSFVFKIFDTFVKKLVVNF